MKLPTALGIPALALLALATTLPLAPVLADELSIREHSFDLADIEEVEFNGNVGAIRILPATGTQLDLVPEIEAQERGWLRSNDRGLVSQDVQADGAGSAAVRVQVGVGGIGLVALSFPV